MRRAPTKQVRARLATPWRGASLERYSHLGITARRGRVHGGGDAFKVQSDTRVAHTLFFMYALQQHAQCLCPRVLTLACPSFFTVADIKGNVGATREAGYSVTTSSSGKASKSSVLKV
jgi:hypothetical protein